MYGHESTPPFERQTRDKKLSNFDEEQAELITSRIIQKITNHFVNHLKEGESMDDGIEWIEKVFQLEQEKIF